MVYAEAPRHEKEYSWLARARMNVREYTPQTDTKQRSASAFWILFARTGANQFNSFAAYHQNANYASATFDHDFPLALKALGSSHRAQV